jgi:hypothetical protein
VPQADCAAAINFCLPPTPILPNTQTARWTTCPHERQQPPGGLSAARKDISLAPFLRNHRNNFSAATKNRSVPSALAKVQLAAVADGAIRCGARKLSLCKLFLPVSQSALQIGGKLQEKGTALRSDPQACIRLDAQHHCSLFGRVNQFGRVLGGGAAIQRNTRNNSAGGAGAASGGCYQPFINHPPPS